MGFHIPELAGWLFVAIVGLVIFGKRLPEVGRSLGKGIVEFKKGLAGIGDEINQGTNALPPAQQRASIGQQPSFKFDPITGQPLSPSTPALPPGAKFDPYTGKPLEPASSATPTQPGI